MPADKDITGIYNSLSRQDGLARIIPEWGDATMRSEFHMDDYGHRSFQYDWDQQSLRFVLQP